MRCIDRFLKALRRMPSTVNDAGLRSGEDDVCRSNPAVATATRSSRHAWDRPSRFGLGALVGVALTLAGCASGDGGSAVEPIAAILASDISIEVDPSGTAATLAVDTAIPVACSVVYGTDGSFGSLAVDNDMQGGAHQDHGPLLSGLTPDTEYQYTLQGADEAGTLYRSDVMTFRTPVAVESALGSNIATAATVSAASSSFSDQFTPGRAIDGDLATEWSTAGDGDDAWIEIDLGEPREITGVAFRTRQMSDGTAVTDTFTITVDDDTTFGPYPAGTDATAFDEAVTTRMVRIDAEETTGGNTGASEIEIYGP